MSRPLSRLLLATDLLFLAYWTLSLAAQLHLLTLPPQLMYAGYNQPRVIAWNWSFLPLDLLFSLTGLTAVTLARQQNPTWRPLALMSLCFTITAGLMAVAYWTLLGEFDPAWYLPNLALILWPLPFLPAMIRHPPPRETIARNRP